MNNKTNDFELALDVGQSFTALVCVDRRLQNPTQPIYQRYPAHTPLLVILKEFFRAHPLPKTAHLRVVIGIPAVTQTLTENRGARLAFVTTKGFGDITAMARQTRNALHDLQARKPDPLVGRKHIFEIEERMGADAIPTLAINAHTVRAQLAPLLHQKWDAIVIGLLHSTINPHHEEVARHALLQEAQRLGLDCPPIFCSHEIDPYPKEYERFSTSLLSACVHPQMVKILEEVATFFRVAEHDTEAKIDLARADGSAAPLHFFRNHPLHSLLAGPAAAIFAACQLSKRLDLPQVITLDMGSQASHVGFIEHHEIPISIQGDIHGHPFRLPHTRFATFAIGGESAIALSDQGPLHMTAPCASAPTLTDAYLLLGRLPVHDAPRLEQARMAFDLLGKKCAANPKDLAELVMDVVAGQMERNIRQALLHQAKDPREAILTIYGGASGFHACRVARLLQIPKILVPPNPSYLGAVGMLQIPYRIRRLKSLGLRASRLSWNFLRDQARELKDDAYAAAHTENRTTSDQWVAEVTLHLRYEGRAEVLQVVFSEDYEEKFHGLYQVTYGQALAGLPIEVIRLEVVLTASQKPGDGGGRPSNDSASLQDPQKPTEVVPVYRQGALQKTPVFHRRLLPSDWFFDGACLILDDGFTLFVEDNALVRNTPEGVLWIENMEDT